jgi:hypothetical protein
MHFDATFFQVQEGTVPDMAVLNLQWAAKVLRAAKVLLAVIRRQI